MTATDFLRTGDDGPVVLLTHGSGAPMDTPFMNTVAEGIAARHCQVVRFEFAYMAERRTTGRKRPPPRAEKLMEEFRAAVAQCGDAPVIVGGKSLGGRVASMIAQQEHAAGRVAGLVCLGYPFHPPGKPENLRIAHLKPFACPALICQGDRDPFGNRALVESLPLDPAIEFCWLPDGEHGFKPRKKSGFSEAQNIDKAAAAIADFARRHLL